MNTQEKVAWFFLRCWRSKLVWRTSVESTLQPTEDERLLQKWNDKITPSRPVPYHIHTSSYPSILLPQGYTRQEFVNVGRHHEINRAFIPPSPLQSQSNAIPRVPISLKLKEDNSISVTESLPSPRGCHFYLGKECRRSKQRSEKYGMINRD